MLFQPDWSENVCCDHWPKARPDINIETAIASTPPLRGTRLISCSDLFTWHGCPPGEDMGEKSMRKSRPQKKPCRSRLGRPCHDARGICAPRRPAALLRAHREHLHAPRLLESAPRRSESSLPLADGVCSGSTPTD